MNVAEVGSTFYGPFPPPTDLRANLVTALAGLDVYDFPHAGAVRDTKKKILF